MNSTNKKIVAVFFGSKSPEHDVSIVTGLQAIKALDPTKYQAFPVYISPHGEWLVGEELLDPANYMLSNNLRSKLTKVVLDLGDNYLNNVNKIGKLIHRKGNILDVFKKSLVFDVALLALHGMHGEDGEVAACMELANIPYTGMRHLGSAIAMNKIITKRLLRSLSIPVLPDRMIKRPAENFIVSQEILKGLIDVFSFPLCVKPCNLGSSIGVAKVNNLEELAAVLPSIFKYDQMAIVEPFIENLVEYNIAVGYIDNKLTTSAIEKPKCGGDLLDFKQKYLSNNNDMGKFGSKSSNISTGMLSMTRELNPKIDVSIESKIRDLAKVAYKSINGSGFPRIDFLSNSVTGEIWLNEINPCPGSFGFYLWESSEHNLLFTELLNCLITEALSLHLNGNLPLDPVPIEARLFSRK